MPWRFTLAAVWLTGLAAAATAAPPAAQSASAGANRDAFEKKVLPFLSQHCLSCHNEEKQRGGVNLQPYTTLNAALKDRKVWDSVVRALRGREMPPKTRTQPADADLEAVLGAVEAGLTAVDCQANRDPGRPTLRRLNRAEYNNTVRDLCGIEFNPAESFPSDDVGYGFDNIGDVLSMPPILLEKYMAAAEQVVEAAVGVKPPPPSSNVRLTAWVFESAEGARVRFESERRLIFHSSGDVAADYNAPYTGAYKVKLRARQSAEVGGQPSRMQIKIDGRPFDAFEVKGTDKTGDFEMKHPVQLTRGKHKISVTFLNHAVDPKTKAERSLIILNGLVEGPLSPGGPTYPDSHRKIFGTMQTKDADKAPKAAQEAAARTVIANFASRAYRRLLRPDEMEKLLGFYRMARQQGDNFEAGIKLTLRAVLVSPNFLFKVELDARPDDLTPHLLSQFELATRLSYFLWSSMPDEELFRVALQGELRRPGVLEAQVKRMLKDPRSAALTDNFAGQWLQLRLLQSASPDKDMFGRFDARLRADMERETEMYFEHVMREDRSVLEFLDSDYSFLNARLAEHYGVKGVRGEDFRKVTFEPDVAKMRGGVLTHGSVLTITSNPTRTSPVKRGKWILENILNSPPPPAPPEVPELEDSKHAASTGSLRQRMELHRKNPACASCHQKMDPLGFGFENFDAVGAWRTQDGHFRVDPSGDLPDGSRFQGPKELRQLLVKQRSDEFVRCLAEKLLTYALGRGIEYTDKCVLDDLTRTLKADGYKFSRLVTDIVKSESFQKRRGKKVEQ